MPYENVPLERAIEARAAQIADLRAAIAHNPQKAKLHGRLAELLYLQGDVDAAIAHRNSYLALRRPGETPRKKTPPDPDQNTAPIYAELRRIAASERPILVGPWSGEVGFELLYWIPFLRRFMEDHGVNPARVHVISRGGAAAWYEGLTDPGRYADLFEFFTPEEISELSRQRHQATGSEKAVAITAWDYEVAGRAFGMEAMEMLHPSLMYGLFREYWRGTAPLSLYAGNTLFRRFSVPSSELLPPLPKKFTAVKLYSRDSFDMNPDNITFVRRVISRLAQKGPVVVLDTGVAAHSHEDYATPDADGVLSLRSIMTPQNNLHIQSCIVARAESVVCTYGGFAYLPLYYQKPVMSFFSENRNHLVKHAQSAFLLSEQSGAPLSIVSVSEASQLL